MSTTPLYPKPHPQTAGRVIDGEAVLILSEISEINVLNEVGSRIFELADGSRTLNEISQAISDEYEVSSQQAEQDVLEFVQKLVKQNVLVLAEQKEG
ncbi:MAG: PqqD family protein [Candidatus Promineifilaceae bacterium]|nr:PqqD family protein [Chloroflexota bacterium]